ncbi:restriction endonuclease subunit S [Geomonas sp. Red69]|uniref:restriction endonuclease subunit S n=1 Tax=Geomonas diazotrophica TaxID=2843197 RepID=UPI001C10003A|nr:restriction endonuclease subunit S [Geomonas diazotrophica]MBU5635904.1 restriction endonuclease subunit S [Geomonas diazotrophica]
MTRDTARLKFICRLGYGDALPKDEDNSGDIPVFGSNGQYSTTVTRNTEAPAIVVGRKGSYGKVNWAPNGCFASDTTFFIDYRQTSSNLRWLYWALQTLRLDEGSQEAAVPGLNRESVYEQRVLWPDAANQVLIANYLDRETARIDALVAEKNRMLALLEEKRASLIIRAVTRGLNPDAPFKSSGLNWLGDIPAHWGIPPVYARFEVQLGKMLDEKKIKGTHLASYLRNADVQWGVINVLNLPVMDFDDESRIRYSLKPGDILVCEGGEIGRSAIWNGEIGECYYQKALHRLRSLNGNDDASFFIFVMRALVSLCVFSSQALAATIQHLPAEKLRNIRYPSPPLSEQKAIVSFLNKEIAYIDGVSEEIDMSIQLLKERRAALITAVVTGQIPIEEMTE